MAKRNPSAKFRQVACRVWDVMRMRGYSNAEKCLWLYLLTGPESHFTGIYSLGIASISEILYTDRRTVRKMLATFEGAGRIRFDENARLVLIPRWFKWKPLENPNQAIAAAVHVKSLPDSPLKGEWVACAKRYLKEDLYAIIERTMRETVNPTVPKGLAQGSGEPLGKGLGEQEVRSKKEEGRTKERETVPPQKSKAASGGLLDAPPSPQINFPPEPEPQTGPVDYSNDSHLAWLSVASNLGIKTEDLEPLTIQALMTSVRLTAFATRRTGD